MKKPKIKHKSKTALKSLRKKAWKLQSEYIRKYENYICFTCGAKVTKTTSQAGHYIHGCLDFDSINIHCQCVRCNKWLHGNSGKYAERLIADYGEEAVIRLRQREVEAKSKGEKYTIEELEHWIKMYTLALKETR